MVVGIIAVLALAGFVSYAPAPLAFFVSALAIIVFPGMVISGLAGGPPAGQEDPPATLVTWFVTGTCAVAAAGLVGFILQVRLHSLMLGLAVGYVCLIIVLLIWGRRSDHVTASPTPPTAKPSKAGIYIALFAIAVGAALLTLLTPRNFDDWYYLAYIRDYVVGKPLGAEDALFNMGNPAPPRIWFGGAWWVVGAILSKASAIDPVQCHQVYMPIFVLPFAVLALFTLARSLFRSLSVGLLAVCLQVLFYLSSAFPQKSVGWFFFCRIAQDKAVSFFVMVPFAAALAVRMIQHRSDQNGADAKNLYRLYWLAVVASFLVHGMGPVWCGLLIVPFAFVEWLSWRHWASIRKIAMLILPVAACGFVLVLGRRLMGEFLETPGSGPISISEATSGIYLPGYRLGNLIETRNSIVWILREGMTILNPLFVTRFPFAIAGVVMTFLLIPRLRSVLAARFLFIVTLSVLLLAYTPVGAAFVSAIMSDKLLFRLAWLFPWGLIACFFVSRLRLRPVLMWLVVAAIGLAIARGNPYNYVHPLQAIRSRNRPSPEAVDALAFLGSQPSPQGRVFAPDDVSRMIAAFLPDALPVTFREEGEISREGLEAMEHKWRERRLFFKTIKNLSVRFIIVENEGRLARTLGRESAAFTLCHTNELYGVWRVEAVIDTIPLGELIR